MNKLFKKWKLRKLQKCNDKILKKTIKLNNHINGVVVLDRNKLDSTEGTLIP